MKVVYILFRGSFFFLDTENTKDGVWQMRWMNALVRRVDWFDAYKEY